MATADGSWVLWTVAGIVGIWVAVALISLFAPDMVTGSEQQHLAVPVAAALPLALAVLDVDARQDAAVEPERMILVDDEVVEVRLEAARRPPFLDVPTAAAARDAETA